MERHTRASHSTQAVHQSKHAANKSLQQEHFVVTVPVKVSVSELQDSINNKFGNELKVKLDQGYLKGEFSANNFIIDASKKDGMRLSADVRFDDRCSILKSIDIFDWFDTTGRVELLVIPKLASKTIF